MTGLARFCLALILAIVGLGPAVADVRLGLGAPLSGPDAIFGTQMRLGVEQGIADVNASGGFLGQPVALAPADDGNEPKKAVDVAKGFVAAKVPFVVGHFSSAATVPATALYAEAGRLAITPSALAPLVTDRGLPLVFRTCGREDQQATVAASYLLAHHVAQIAILHDRTSAGKTLADGVRKALAAQGVREVFYGSFEKGSRDASALVGRLKASGAQVAVWGGGPAEAGLLVHQLRDANVKVALMGGMAIASSEFASLAGPAADGTLMVFPRDPRQRASAADLLRRLKAKGAEPDGLAFYAYAAVQVLRQAIDAAHSLDPTAVAAIMHSGMTFKTVLGDFAFDAKGDPTVSDEAVYVWRKAPGGRMAYDDLADS